MLCQFKIKSYLCTRKQETNTLEHRGVEQLVARQAHNLEVIRSSRVSATKYEINTDYSVVYLVSRF